jgi:hypothetical protein
VHPDLGSAKALVRWNRDHLGWKSHDSNQTSAFTLNVCAFEVKTDCRLQLLHKALTSTREVQLRKYRINDILKTQK